MTRCGTTASATADFAEVFPHLDPHPITGSTEGYAYVGWLAWRDWLSILRHPILLVQDLRFDRHQRLTGTDKPSDD